MKLTRLSLLIVVGLVLLLSTPAQSQYVKTLGGTNDDWGWSVMQTYDGGFVVAGWTESFGAGEHDLLLVKFDALGNHLWTKTLGGSSEEYVWNPGVSVIEASDGGLVVVGCTESFGAGLSDFLLTKLDSSGNHLWTRTLGGSGKEEALTVIEVSDGGLVVTGATYSFGAGLDDLLLAKFDSTGNLLWIRTFGGPGYDIGTSLIETSDGGLVVAGWLAFEFGIGWNDFLLARFDSTGNLLWIKTLGGEGSYYDNCLSMIEASDGGFVMAGWTTSFGAGNYDLLLTKFDSSGTHLWTRTLGGTSSDYGYSVIQASDGGLVVTGSTDSFGPGVGNLLVAKFDSSGNHLWTRTLGGDTTDIGYSVIQASDGELVVTGGTQSFGAGNQDLLLARLDISGNTCLGEFVTPTVQSISPKITSPTLTVTTPSPTITSPSPTITSPTPTVTLVCTFSPRITSITDVGNDQGRQVRVKWDRCYYDTVGSPVTITEYSLWRRIDEDKFNNESHEMWLSDVEMLGGAWLYPPGDWDFIKTVPAIGEEEYNTVCPTLGDSTLAEGMYWSVFFVIAHTQEPLVHYDSDPDSGYSLDNIPPLPIQDLGVDPSSWFTLEWTVPGEYVGEQPIASYDIRYNTVPVGPDTQAWWDAAQACAGDGFFNLVVGEKDSFQVAGECGCHPEIYFAIKGLDNRPNASRISNIVYFMCGDVGGDGVVDLDDVLYLISYLYKGGVPPEPMAAGDATCDEIIDLGDLLHIISYLYKGGLPPCGS